MAWDWNYAGLPTSKKATGRAQQITNLEDRKRERLRQKKARRMTRLKRKH